MKTFFDIFDVNDINHKIWTNFREKFKKNTNEDINENINEDEISIFECVSSDYQNDVTSLVLVKNIPYSATAKEICEFFVSQFGEVKDVSILADDQHGKYYSRGIGIVEFKNKEAFKKAIAKQNIEFKSEEDSETRVLNITQARKNHKYDTAVIHQIPKNSKEEDIINAFKIKKPIKIKIKNERFCSIAYAKFASPSDLNIAIQYNQNFLGNVSMTQINFDDLQI